MRKVMMHYRHGVSRILERAEWILEKWPGSKGAAANKSECDDMLAYEKAVYQKARTQVRAIDPDQMQVDFWEALNED